MKSNHYIIYSYMFTLHHRTMVFILSLSYTSSFSCIICDPFSQIVKQEGGGVGSDFKVRHSATGPELLRLLDDSPLLQKGSFLFQSCKRLKNVKITQILFVCLCVSTVCVYEFYNPMLKYFIYMYQTVNWQPCLLVLRNYVLYKQHISSQPFEQSAIKGFNCSVLQCGNGMMTHVSLHVVYWIARVKVSHCWHDGSKLIFQVFAESGSVLAVAARAPLRRWFQVLN